MNIQKLIILGILKEFPKHGYEIKKFIQTKLDIFTSLGNKSIYYPLKIMEKEGLIKKKIVKSARRLTRYIYTITPFGDREFSKNANLLLLSEKRPFMDVDIPLYFLPYLDTKEVIARLKVRRIFLDKVKCWLKSKLGDDHLAMHQKILLKHHLNLLFTEEKFFKEMVKVIKEGEYEENFDS